VQKLCKVLDGSQALQEAEEREQDMSVNDEEMADRSVSFISSPWEYVLSRCADRTSLNYTVSRVCFVFVVVVVRT